MNRGRAFFAIAGAVCAVAVGLAVGPGTPEAEASVWQGEMIRLHVVARSDSEADQRIKLAVRDALLREFGERLQADSYQAAADAVEANLDDIQRLAQRIAREMGETGEVTAAFGLYDFPSRVYGNITVPAGTYQALRVVIGGGAGRNWWCVIYPALCLTDADCPSTEQQAMPLPDAPQPSPEPQFTGALWDWIQSLF